ncbi:MAG: 50S ribosomal protein L18 [Patescibacteria group bacterium]
MKRLFKKNKNKLRQVRHARVRATIVGTALKPRLSIFRGLRSVTAQLINDDKGQTLCYVSAKEVVKQKAEKYAGKIGTAYMVGKLLAEKAKAKKITKVVFDRAGYKYHGRVKALAEGAREGGLVF